jgi:predicted permease
MFRRKRNPGDFEGEIAAHLQLEADCLREQGLSPDEALTAARRSFGSVTRAAERFYEAGRWMPWDNLRRDIRFGARVLARDASFSTLAVLGLALGIGVSTAIFALINLSIRMESGGRENRSYVGFEGLVNGRPRDFSYSEFRYYQDHAGSFRDVVATSGWEHFIMAPLWSGAAAEEVQGRFASAGFLTAGGLRPALGRIFTAAEERTGNPAVVVLDYGYWKQRFGGDPGILGRSIILNARPLTVVGVSDARLVIGNTSQFYLPLALQPTLHPAADWVHDPDRTWLMLEAWLRPGVSVRQSQAEIDVLAKAFVRSARGDSRIVISEGGPNPRKRREIMAMVAAVTAAVSMILLIACSNLANLLLARAVVRRREIGVRLSLGASRGRLISQLLTESMLLALAGGVGGLVLSYWLAKSALLLSHAAPGLLLGFHADPRVMLYGIGLSLATGVSFGLAPALAATRTNLSQALHAESLSGTALDRRLWSPRNLLVMVPLTASLMLLLGAGVAVRNVQEIYLGGPAFDASRLVGVSFALNMQGYDEARTRQFQDNLRLRIAAMPGVASMALATALPLANGAAWLPLVVEGAPPPAGDQAPHTDYNIISPGYFETIGAAMARGRGFTPSDREGSAPVALVNQELARQYWPHEESIGKRIRLGGGSTFFEVVGVAPDLQDATQRFNSVRPTVYVPYNQGKLFLAGLPVDTPPYQVQFLVRARSAVTGVKAALRQEIAAADPALRVRIETIQDALEERAGPMRTISLLLGALGALALLMAAVGIYAILAYTVSQRTREIGIRAALGAQNRQILGLVMQRTILLAATSIGVGLVGAFVITQIFARDVAKFGELDIPTCIAVSAILAAVALAASYLPARKALRVDPALALRCE